MTTTPAPAHFDEELLDKHLEYTYDNGLINSDLQKYEFWVKNHERIVYAIHGGPMAGRSNFQTAYYQRIRENLWQVSWIEETGTTVTIALDLPMKRITTFMAFSYGHWNFPEKAHGYKRGQLEQWRELAKLGNQTTDRHPLPEQATLDKVYQGKGELQDIEMDWPTL
ncbi:hypothetical protein RQP46_002621 [Phenoliferia psychrophenolica]